MSEIAEFGSNPGRLRMLLHVPASPPAPGAPLLVVLHGCGQSAAQFAREAGWVALSERLRVPLVLPEQRDDNNRHRCFNWFRPTDIARGRGEVLSIRQMTAEALRRFRGDPRRVFAVGLSAGGSMAAALLAAYPDVFAAGAVVAGLPVGAARTPVQALSCMDDGGLERTPLEWAMRARAVGPAHWRGAWPRLSVWQGAKDRTVHPRNAENLVAQWTALHRFEAAADQMSAPVPGAVRSVWGSPHRPAVEFWLIDSLAHAFPVGAAATPPTPPPLESANLLAPWLALTPLAADLPFAGGLGARWVQEVGIDAAGEIALFFELG